MPMDRAETLGHRSMRHVRGVRVRDSVWLAVALGVPALWAGCSDSPATSPGSGTQLSGAGVPSGSPGNDARVGANSTAPGLSSTAAQGGVGPNASHAGNEVNAAGTGTLAGSQSVASSVKGSTAGAGANQNAAASGGSVTGGAGTNAAVGGQSASGASVSVACEHGFCDGFETSTSLGLDPARWEIVTPNCSGDAQVDVDDTVVHSGHNALRVRASGGYCNHVFVRPKTSQLPAQGTLYGRFFVRFEHALAAGHITFMAMRDARAGKDLRLGGQSDVLIWNRESDDATLPELSPTGVAASVAPAVSQWLCIEFAIDPVARTLHTWVDGRALPGLQVEGEPTQDLDAQWQRAADWQPSIEDARWGWESYGDQGNTLWFDDLALGGAPFGCDL